MRKATVLLTAVAAVVAVVAWSSPALAAERAVLIGKHEIRSAGKPGGGTANCSNDGASNGLSATTGWVVAGATTAHLNTATVPSRLGSVVASLQASYDAWRSADPAVPRITVATDGTATKASANHRYELLWGKAGGQTLAVTYTWRWNTGEIESDTVFNTMFKWFQAGSEGDGCYETQPYYDVRNIGTHEFGHTYGLDHPGDDRFETMYAYGYTGETLKWSPANGDSSGISSLY